MQSLNNEAIKDERLKIGRSSKEQVEQSCGGRKIPGLVSSV